MPLRVLEAIDVGDSIYLASQTEASFGPSLSLHMRTILSFLCHSLLSSTAVYRLPKLVFI